MWFADSAFPYKAKVIARKGGRGDITYYISINKYLHISIGKPEEYRIAPLGDTILLLPVRNVEIAKPEPILNWITEKAKKKLAKIKPRRIEHYKVNEYLFRKRILNEGINEVIVFCIDHELQHKAIIHYGNGKAEMIEYGISCGYSGTSAGTTTRLVIMLSQRNMLEQIIKEVDQLIRSDKLRGKAVKITVSKLDNKVYITPLKNP